MSMLQPFANPRLLTPGEEVRVLLIEDDPEDAYLVKSLFSRFTTIRVVMEQVPSVQQARDRSTDGRYQVMLVDQRLGSETGISFIRWLRQSGDLRPCILLTGMAGQEVDLEAVEAGASDFLQKENLEAPLLERTIRYALVQYRSTQQLLQERERHRLYYENAVEGIFRLDLRGRLIDANPALALLLGFDTPEELLHEVSAGRLPPMFGPVERFRMMRRLLSHGRVVALESMLHLPDGRNRWISLNCRLQGKENNTIVEGSITDIADRKEMEARLLHAAFHDGLTGLPNRNLLLERLSTGLRGLGRRGVVHCGLLVLDLDDFGRINENLGHAVGDRLVQLVANRLRRILRSEDTIARIGGDEFGILLPYVEGKEAVQQVAVKILQILLQPFRLQGKDVLVNCSIGVALGSDGSSAEGVLRDADSALQYAKEQGKKRVEFFTGFLHERARRRFDLEAEIAAGLREGQFQAWFQPIISVATGEILGAEALVRWHHPDKGLVSPIDFIPVAESSGLIVELGKQVLEDACRWFSAWRQAGFANLYVSVNVSGRQFDSGNLRSQVEQVLANHGLPASSLTLEVTESVAMERMELASPQLAELAGMGIRIAIDDFGTGYSSLAYLRKFPFGTLKIDRSFIRNLPGDRDDAEIVRAIAAMAKALGLVIVAEGIETVPQLHFLESEVQCDSFQGYLASRPLPPEDFEHLLRSTGGTWIPPKF